MKEIILPKGRSTQVDVCFNYLSQFKWNFKEMGNTFYVYRLDEKKKVIYMHNEILKKLGVKGLSKIIKVQHLDGNGFNNVLANLKIIINEIKNIVIQVTRTEVIFVYGEEFLIIRKTHK